MAVLSGKQKNVKCVSDVFTDVRNLQSATAMEKLTDMDSIKIHTPEFRRNMADIAVITGASSGLGVKFLEAVVNRYPQMDEKIKNSSELEFAVFFIGNVAVFTI